MGGLLIADAAIAIAGSRPEKTAPLWPRIIACVAFDTPYYGLHPFVFKNSATKAVTYAQAAHQLANNLGLFGSAASVSAAASSVATGQPDSKLKSGKELVQSVQTSPSPQSNTSSSKLGWGMWAPAALGAVVAGAAAGAAFYKKEELTSSLGWAGDHLKYVGTLWDDKALRRRIDTLIAIRKESGVHFHK